MTKKRQPHIKIVTQYTSAWCIIIVEQKHTIVHIKKKKSMAVAAKQWYRIYKHKFMLETETWLETCQLVENLFENILV